MRRPQGHTNSRRSETWLAAVAVLTTAAVVLTGCGAQSPGSGGGKDVTVKISDSGCTTTPKSTTAGPTTFKVSNVDAGKVTEAELRQGSIIVGEKENLTPGLSGTFSLNLKPGKYQMYCPNAKVETKPFTVTGANQRSSDSPAVVKAKKQAVATYRNYVRAQVAKLVPATKKFTDAVRSGDVATAKANFASARAYYERVEPVAESFGDLDPDIDARVNDVDSPKDWTGFHRIEKTLYTHNTTNGMTEFATKLDRDVNKLKKLVDGNFALQPATIANGAVELLNEVANSKITGEEDRYSHTDMSDLAANVQGSETAYKAVRPALALVDKSLAKTVDARFAAVDKVVAKYRQGPGYVPYSKITGSDRRSLTSVVNALAEPLSKVAAKIA